MREINVRAVGEKVRDLCIAANFELGSDVVDALEGALRQEVSPVAIEILAQLLENAKIAKEERIPLCQDTGYTVVFIDLGQNIHLVGGDLEDAIQDGVRQGYREGYLRKSICHPFTRRNTGDNTPATIHLQIVPGDRLRLIVAPKGGGSENMSQVQMLTPSVGIDGVKDHVVERVRVAGPNPCPPTIVGVGIGGTFEWAALLAKKALLRPVGTHNGDPDLAEIEEDLLRRINRLGIGPQGLGGRTTSLAVHLNVVPCHIASLPVAVNIQCHAHRHKEATL
jgi:fumarate hydratase subunit alpha